MGSRVFIHEHRHLSMSHPSSADSALSDLERQALEWFVRLEGGLPAAEQRVFEAWLAADPAHGRALGRWQGDWSLLDGLPQEGVDALRRDLAADQAAERRAAQSASSPRRPWWRRLGELLPQAALAGSVAAAGCGYLAWDHWQRQPVYSQSFATLRGQQRLVDLPDGSRLRLDTATRAEAVLYRHRREVRLPEGQAVFSIKGDPSRPFDVLAGPLRITVVGTRFSVRFTPGVSGQGGVRVAVEEGHVRVASLVRGRKGASLPPADEAPGAVELVAGQQVASDAAGELGQVSAISSAGMAPWRDNRVSFDDTPLGEALAEFERYGDTRLTVGDPAVAALRLTGTFDPHRLDSFIRALPQVLPVRLQEQDGTTEILPRK